MTLIRRFRMAPVTTDQAARLAQDASRRLGVPVHTVRVEWCFHVEVTHPLRPEAEVRLDWLLCETFAPDAYGSNSFLADSRTVGEVGPRLNFQTAFSAKAVDACRACGIPEVTRLERSTRYGVDAILSDAQMDDFLAPLHDRMTEVRYLQPPTHLAAAEMPNTVVHLDLLGDEGAALLHSFNRDFGCGWDEEDQAFILGLFRTILERNPTDAELFHIAQANSEHCRHHRFRGRHVIDGVEVRQSLMDIVQRPYRTHPANARLAFVDDASAIDGPEVPLYLPARPGQVSPFVAQRYHIYRTKKVETHNHPSAICPIPGAATGSGGEIRDGDAVGRGGLQGAGATGYATANLCIPGFIQPWETDSWPHPPSYASPLEIMLGASTGAFDYGNCFGRPVTHGFVRTFGMYMSDDKYRAYMKPIMLAGGAGKMLAIHSQKGAPEVGALILLLGGPGYRIGLGGGAASSMSGGSNAVDLDFKSVQRADPQMERRVDSFFRACIELGPGNPFITCHDLGAGGVSNAISELVHPAGGRVRQADIPCGDASLSVLELWSNESQERMAVLILPESLELVERIAEREGVPLAVIGEVTGDGRIVLESTEGTKPVDLPLGQILGAVPQKTYHDRRQPFVGLPLRLPDNLTVMEALERVLRLPAVGSKAAFIHKVDRTVGGHIALQQAVGRLALPVADCAILADSFLAQSGTVHAIGEQPVAGMMSPGAAARLAVAEALFNLSGAAITQVDHIKLAANWMLAVKLPGRGAWLVDAAEALATFAEQVRIAIDGGKDSLSMESATTSPSGDPAKVESPPTVVISAYAPMEDVAEHVTPDLKRAGNQLVHITVSPGQYRLGGSALAQVYGQMGDVPADVDDPDRFVRTFQAIQEILLEGSIVSLHDVSDGGLITTVLEMAFAGHLGMDIRLNGVGPALDMLFAQEPGVVVECADAEAVVRHCAGRGVAAEHIGSVTREPVIAVTHHGQEVLRQKNDVLRAIWSETSWQLERLQGNPETADAERESTKVGQPPTFRLTYDPKLTPSHWMTETIRPKVAIIRAEGTNGDREMAVAFHLAGFDAVDVTTQEFLDSKIDLAAYNGLVFPGGFSYADVLDSAKGWAGMIRFHASAFRRLLEFRSRPDTFILGVCNGCQLLALLGLVPDLDLPTEEQPRFVHNQSGKFESRTSFLRIEDSPAILFRGMVGSILPCWTANAEGRLLVPTERVQEAIVNQRLIPASYVAPNGEPTQLYPFNPNGSFRAAAGLCSPDGRVLALMPHEERSAIPWQTLPWRPAEWYRFPVAVWLRFFQNARHFVNHKRIGL